MDFMTLKDFLDEKVVLYNHPKFIETDPIQLVHAFSRKEDQEIAGFLTATIAWGNRKMILKSAHQLMQHLGYSPYDFVMNYHEKRFEHLPPVIHRTFQQTDLHYFLLGLQHIYQNHGGLEKIIAKHRNGNNLHDAIHYLRDYFLQLNPPSRVHKHLSDPWKGSASKRIHMYFRWMCRKDQAGVDLGIWSSIPMSELSCPLDIHSGNVARKLGLLQRKQNDHKAVLELDAFLRSLDANDPAKYDFALFGLGVFEGF